MCIKFIRIVRKERLIYFFDALFSLHFFSCKSFPLKDTDFYFLLPSGLLLDSFGDSPLISGLSPNKVGKKYSSVRTKTKPTYKCHVIFYREKKLIKPNAILLLNTTKKNLIWKFVEIASYLYNAS